MKTRVVGYVRVSTENQAEEGASLEAQRERLKAYATAMDLELVAVEEDAGVSAKSLRRPGLQRALAMLDAGQASALLVTKLDRLTRSVKDLGELIDGYFAQRCSLMSLGDAIDTRTAAGRLVLNVLVSVSQWEREAAGERTRETLRHLRSRGVVLGPSPLGMRRSGEVAADGRRLLEVDAEEQATVERIRELRREGLSLRAICEMLEEEGRRPKRGGGWGASSVRRVLRRAG